MMNVASVRAERLVPGFDDPVDCAQRTYRAVLEAMARPGRVFELDPGLEPVAPLGTAALAIALTLFDSDTPVWLDSKASCPGMYDNLRFHCGCPVVTEPGAAAFAVIADPVVMPPLASFRTGGDTYPDRSATLIIEVHGFETGERFVLAGPGIEHRSLLWVDGLPTDFVGRWLANGALYPAGVDLILTAGSRVAALPRSARLETA